MRTIPYGNDARQGITCLEPYEWIVEKIVEPNYIQHDPLMMQQKEARR